MDIEVRLTQDAVLTGVEVQRIWHQPSINLDHHATRLELTRIRQLQHYARQTGYAFSGPIILTVPQGWMEADWILYRQADHCRLKMTDIVWLETRAPSSVRGLRLAQATKLAQEIPVLTKTERLVLSHTLAMTEIDQLLAAVVDQKPVITLRLIAAANTPRYRRGAAVRSLREALVTLGLRAALQLVQGLLLLEHIPEQNARLLQLWGMAPDLISTARGFAPQFGKDPEVAGLAANLMLFGEAMLMQVGTPVKQATEDRLIRHGAPLGEVQRFLYGVSGLDMGLEISRHWQMPPEVIHCLTVSAAENVAETGFLSRMRSALPGIQWMDTAANAAPDQFQAWLRYGPKALLNTELAEITEAVPDADKVIIHQALLHLRP